MVNQHTSFKQYYNSVVQLREAAKTAPKIAIKYSCKKYCKVPIVTESGRDFISLKPKDIISVVWESLEDHKKINKIIVTTDDINESVAIDWHLEKIKNWLTNNTSEVVNPFK